MVVSFHLPFIRGEIKARSCDEDNTVSLGHGSDHIRENARKNAAIVGSTLSMTSCDHHSEVFVEVSTVTSWLTAWESFPFVQSPGGEKMELLSYCSIRKIWVEGIEFSSRKEPKSTLPPFKKCMESYSKKSGLPISHINASSPPFSPQDNCHDTCLLTSNNRWREIIGGVHNSHNPFDYTFP